jgi:hypothetical protein
LYSLPTDELKYRDYVPLNQLWESYLVSTCWFSENSQFLTVTSF